METKALFNSKNLLLSVFLSLLLAFLINGCSSLYDLPCVMVNSGNYDADNFTLKRADNAFYRSDYKKALEIYRMLSQLAGRSEIRRKALYGLACTRLIMAETDRDIKGSILLWDTWSQLMPEKLNMEDPRMLKPLLRQKSFYIKQKKIYETKIKRPEAKPGLGDIEKKNKTIFALKNILKDRDRKIEMLKHQIATLEAIDQKIQQKKKEIAAP